MRRFLLILMVCTTTAGFAQDRSNKLALSPIQLIGYNRLNIEYERALNEKTSVAFYLGQTGAASRKVHDQYSKLSEQNVSFKYYLRSFDQSSFSLGGTLTVSSGTIINTDTGDSAENIGALGLLANVGYQLIIRSFYVQLCLGGGYSFTNDLFASASYSGTMEKPGDLLLVYGIKMGVCF